MTKCTCEKGGKEVEIECPDCGMWLCYCRHVNKMPRDQVEAEELLGLP